ncbi:MAG: uncharacterized protein QG623_253 [Patescibacteria group bacterium]|nr:uncharacterized protein [Patescibacteria group bacterium]
MKDAHLQVQIIELEKILNTNPNIGIILDGLEKLGIEDYYLAGGCITQTVWNYLHGFQTDANIKDYDVAYYDQDDSYEAEDSVIRAANARLANLDVSVELRNQARVHIWYEERNGKSAPRHKSAAAGINSWPVTACCVGVRKDSDGLKIYAPFGLNDLFGLIVRPNKAVAPEKVYDDKLSRWTKVWSKLQVMPWNDKD